MTSSDPTPGGIVYVCDFNAHGGTQTHLLHLLSRLDRGRFAPQLVTLNLEEGLRGRLQHERITVRDLGLKGAYRWSSASSVLSLAGRIRREKPALLHGFLYQGNILTALLSVLTGVPCLTSVRNVDLWKRRRHRVLSSLAHRRALRVVFNSSRVRDETLAAESIRPEKAVVIPNGVADIGPRPSPRDPAAPVTLLCVASLRPKKGHLHLLDSFRLVRQKMPGARLLVAGEGPQRLELESRARSLGLAEAVAFPGYQSDVASLLARADLFVLASLEEGMPNALLEAMSAGLPAVVTAVGGNPEVVVPGETGWLVGPADPEAMARRILQVLEDPGRGDAMGRAARRLFQERFSLERMVGAYEALYSEILG